MKSPDYKKNDFTETNEQGDEYSENRLKKYLEHNSELRKIYEEQIVAEKSLSEIITGKWRIKHDAQMRAKYKDRKLRSDDVFEGVQLLETHLEELVLGTGEDFEGVPLLETPLEEPTDDVFEGVQLLETPLEESGLGTGDDFEGVPLLETRLEEPIGGEQTTQQPIPSLKVGNREPHSGPPLRSERQRTLAKERYRKRKESETKEHRDQCNKKRRERYMAQVVHPNLLSR